MTFGIDLLKIFSPEGAKFIRRYATRTALMSSDFNRSPVRARFDLNRRVILPLRREGAEKDIWLYRAINNPIRSDHGLP